MLTEKQMILITWVIIGFLAISFDKMFLGAIIFILVAIVTFIEIFDDIRGIKEAVK